MEKRPLYIALLLTAALLVVAATLDRAAGATVGASPLTVSRSASLADWTRFAAEDSFPRGCVDCHVNRPDIGMDVRLGTHMRQWTQQVDPQLLAKAQAVTPREVTLLGRHPAVPDALRNIPGSCLQCHSASPATAPPFAPLVHMIHLAGEENHFVTLFGGRCVHCHKLDTGTGGFTIPSAPEH
jgi:hypothetical protein